VSGQATAGKPANGERSRLEELLAQVQILNKELRRLAPRVGSAQGPGKAELRRVGNALAKLTALVETALSVVEQQDPPSQRIRGLVGPLRTLDASLTAASRALLTYGKTLEHERIQQQAEERTDQRRSNTRYAEDQDELDNLRLRSKGCLADLLEHLRGLIKELTRQVA
jgi:type II secretory pathway component PulJ